MPFEAANSRWAQPQPYSRLRTSAVHRLMAREPNDAPYSTSRTTSGARAMHLPSVGTDYWVSLNGCVLKRSTQQHVSISVLLRRYFERTSDEPVTLKKTARRSRVLGLGTDAIHICSDRRSQWREADRHWLASPPIPNEEHRRQCHRSPGDHETRQFLVRPPFKRVIPRTHRFARGFVLLSRVSVISASSNRRYHLGISGGIAQDHFVHTSPKVPAEGSSRSPKPSKLPH